MKKCPLELECNWQERNVWINSSPLEGTEIEVSRFKIQQCCSLPNIPLAAGSSTGKPLQESRSFTLFLLSIINMLKF